MDISDGTATEAGEEAERSETARDFEGLGDASKEKCAISRSGTKAG